MDKDQALKDILADEPVESIYIDYWFAKTYIDNAEIHICYHKNGSRYLEGPDYGSGSNICTGWGEVGPKVEKLDNLKIENHDGVYSAMTGYYIGQSGHYALGDTLLEAIKRVIIKKGWI